MKTKNNSFINWAQPSITEEDFYSIKDCFDRKWLSQGEKVELFESCIAKHSKREFCVAVSSGTTALLSLLMSLMPLKSKEIIIPALTYIALPESIILLGGIPVLADIEENSGMITPETVLSSITKKTKAVIAIDYSGFANDWSELSDLCNEKHLTLIIDSASSFLAKNHEKYAGSQGDAALFSFQSVKPIISGEGGAIVTNDSNLAKNLRKIRNHGEVSGKKFFYDTLGSNFRMTDIIASLGISQIQRKDQILKDRQEIIDEYLKNGMIKDIAMNFYKDPNIKSNTFTFTIRTRKRDNLKKHLNESNIQTRIMWPYSVKSQPIFRNSQIKEYRNNFSAVKFAASCISLPVHSGLSKENVNYINNTIESYLISI